MCTTIARVLVHRLPLSRLYTNTTQNYNLTLRMLQERHQLHAIEFYTYRNSEIGSEMNYSGARKDKPSIIIRSTYQGFSSGGI